jgi:hypothetical protein
MSHELPHDRRRFPHAPRGAVSVAVAVTLAMGAAAAAMAPQSAPPANPGGLPATAQPRPAPSGVPAQALKQGEVGQGIPQHAQPAVAGPVVVMPGTVMLGFIEPRSAVTRDIPLRNTSDKPVRILKAVPSCTCTTLDVTGKVIPPLGELLIPITMKVSSATGIKTANVQFVLEGVPTVLTVAMQGEVSYPVRALQLDTKTDVRAPYIDAFTDASKVKGVIEVIAVDGRPFAVTAVQGNPPKHVGFDPASDPPRTSYTVEYDLSGIECAKMPPYLIVSTDRADAPVIDMRVRHACTRIDPSIPFAEFRTNLGAVKPGSTTDYDFELKQARGWTATGVTCDDPRIRIEFVKQKPVDSEGHSLVALKATVSPDARGMLLVPVTLTATGPNGRPVSSVFWLYADVR